MKFKRLIKANPFQKVTTQKGLKAIVAGSADYYGANSLETFSNVSGLTYTHEDAQGFLDYPTSFQPANFWFKDSGVRVWEYEETYDNWQDTYGMDSVMVFYHSGHGGMDGNGVFQLPLGGLWDNRDWAFSNRMAFANEELRYLFWSTCFSLRVSGPDNPVRTWWSPNQGGLRMLFGYETTSIDAPEYGQYFWDGWKQGKTFARAFLDASWRISHNQVPVVMAAGANASEAINRLNTERYFSRTPVTKGWYQWQWIGTLPTRSLTSELKLPKEKKAIIIDRELFNDERIAKIANQIGVPKTKAQLIQFDEKGNKLIDSKDIKLHVNNEGALNIHFGKANLNNQELINEKKAISIAERAIGDLGFNGEIELKLGNTRHVLTSGGTLNGSGTMEKASAIETIIQFRQCHKGVESVNSDHGLIAISIDNDGKITNIYNTCKKIIGETDKPRSIIDAPPANGKTSEIKTEQKFNESVKRIVNRSSSNGIPSSANYRVLREKIGYDFSGSLGLVVHQKDVEVDLDSNFSKRYKIRVPVMG
ncbi:hypothetical protein C3K47_15880 [Solitalea longa]|uniref:Uncharacterized protein n=1 Tax=Solitalea longa TaxID=2079460 RepID=A0A2S4ZY22_9SPHI|nr:DUF6345 domain-containing protein [Solitalea longa]POY35261.1 hypothetical protein C3K47_15880 [Solitalea longa]